MRKIPVTRPKMVAPTNASGRIDDGANAAGAEVQNAGAASPEKKEVLRQSPPPGSHHGLKACDPLNSVVAIGRARPQWCLKITSGRTIAVSKIVLRRKIPARPETRSGLSGRISFAMSATMAGAVNAHATHMAPRRAYSALLKGLNTNVPELAL